MKAKKYSFKSYPIIIAFLFLSITAGFNSVNAQCPTVTNSTQNFCNVQSLLVGDLLATDNGGGIVWYASAASTTPLSNSDFLINGQSYYADDSTGTCGTRAVVNVIIYGPPTGNNFQGVCIEDPSMATVGNLMATGNDVQWYLSPSGGIALNDAVILIDDTIYYADQASPDGNCRTSRLAVHVTVGITPIPTGDMLQEFCLISGFTPTVGDLIASGNNNWYISIFSALPLSDSTPLIDGQIYYATTVDPPCESAGRLFVLVDLVSGPDAGENGLLDICSNNMSSTYDLFLSLEGNPDSGGTWTPTLNSGTGIFDPNSDPIGEYTYSVNSNNSCTNESATVTVAIVIEPNAGTNATEVLCSIENPIDLFNSLGGNPDSGGIWSPALTSGTGLFDPAIDNSDVYTYTVTGTAPCADATATINVSVIEYSEAGENGTIEICNNDGTIDLFDSLGGNPDSGGTWSPTLISGTGVFDPLSDVATTYTYSFSGNNPCPDDSATVTVTVNPLPNAGTNATIEICSNDLATVNLFVELGGSPETGGTWSPLLTSGTGIFDPSTDAPGIYTYTLTGISPCPNVSSEVNIIVIQEPIAGIDAILNVCDNNGTVDLFDSLGGTPEVGGTWSPVLASGTGIFDPLVDPVTTYTYTVIGTSPCANTSADVAVSVTPFANAGTDGSIVICTNDGTIDLFDSLGGNPQTGGTWTPTLNSGTGIYDPLIDPEDTYIYTITGIAACSDDSAEVEVAIEISSEAGENGSLDICSNNMSSTFDLFLSLEGNPDTGGTWTPTLNSGSGIFDPNSDPIGEYTYTVNSNNSCPNDSATVTVTINPLPNAGTNATIEICSNDLATVNLFDELGGSPETGGTWSPLLTSGTGIFDPSTDAPGIYTYTLTGISPCPNVSSDVNIIIIQEPIAGIDATLNVCDNNGTVDLFDSLGGTPEVGGTWSPVLASGTGIFDPLVDPVTTYTYTVIGTSPCANTSADVAVSVTPFANAGTDGSIVICTNDGTIDLFDSLGGNPQTGGTWTPTLNSGTGIYDPLIDPEDTYVYTITGIAPCSDDSAEVEVAVEISPEAGENGTLTICDFTNSVDLFNSLGGSPQTEGTWSPALSSGTGIFDPNVDTEGIYTYTVDSICGSVSATVTVTFANQAGSNASVEICATDSNLDLMTILGGSPDSGGLWSPSLSSGTGVFDPSIDNSGIYTYTVSNSATICPDDSATVTVTVNPLPNAGTNATIEICSNDLATVNLFDELGGSPETGGTWSPLLTSGTGIFDPSTDAPGIYTYTLTGISPCPNVSSDVNIIIIQEPIAGIDATLNVCDNNGTVDLFDSLGGTPEVGGTWSPVLASGTGIFDPLVDPVTTYTYTVIGTSPCANTSADVVVSVSPLANAGTDGSIVICTNDGTIDLFDSLGGNPQTGGTWTPTLNSGTGIYDPLIDSEDTYIYTITGIAPCSDDSAEVEVAIEISPEAGENGTLNICDFTNSVDLFNSLGGSPQTEGTWSPALTSGTGIFDPNVDIEGIYTYTVDSICGSVSATVTITFANQAGNNASVEICATDSNLDLMTILGGSPDSGGLWSPSLTSGTGVFDPSIDNAGIYTYTVSNSTTICPDDSATVTVTIPQVLDNGNDGTLNLCNSTVTVDLYNNLSGSIETGGTWSPTLTSGSGIFDPNIDPEGIYTYTITNSCGTSSATVNVSFSNTNDAGTNGTIELCNTDALVNLFNSLGGTPDIGGSWSPVLTSGTGVFDPSIDSGGTYTYTVSNSASLCPNATATVEVLLLETPNTGNDATLNLCNSTAMVDLFDSLTGNPETGGIWSPTLTSGTGVFDPNLDPEGNYSYTLSNTCGTSLSIVTVSFSNLNDAGTNETIELCSTDATVNLYFSLGGTPQTGGTWSPTLASGTGIFDPSIDGAGTYTYTVSNSASNCPSATANVEVTINQGPNAGNNGTLNLCNSTTTVDLFNSLSGSPEIGGTWSPALASGTGSFDPNTDSEGTYTYTLSNTCGTNSAAVTVSFSALNNAGTDGSIDFCNSDSAVDLYNSLGGMPDVGGTWSPALTSGTGFFDPSIDAAGTYTYIISNPSSNCPIATANVTVGIDEPTNAGANGTLNLCNSTTTVNLFNSLTGSPQSGGIWSPTLTSGTGDFDPNIDPEGTYTYTLNNSCGSNSATVTVSLSALNDAGTDGSIEFCINDAPVDLFSSLQGTPQTGGTWSPALTSETGVFDPAVDIAGTYIYTIAGNSTGCPSVSANVVVTFAQGPNAGNDGTLDLCISTSSVDLFDSLTGAPESGGTWSPALTSGTGDFDPSIDLEDTYTYTLSNSCGTSTATVVVSFSAVNDAGTDGLIEFCSNDAAVDLFNSLGGTPEIGGIWSPLLASTTGVFDPAVDTAGTYIYTVSNSSSTCPAATASVEVTILALPNAGSDTLHNICIDDTNTVDLFEKLGGTPETGGVWTPALASGTGEFDPTIDVADIYTYTLTSTECNLTNSASVTVNILDLPDATGLDMAVQDDNIVCVGLEDAIINITGASQLIDGNYLIVYQLSVANTSTNTISISISGGNATFTIPQALLENPGETEVMLSQLFVLGQTCAAITSTIEPIKIFVEEVAAPHLIDNGSEFCLEEVSTIQDLSNNIVEDGTVIWYDEATIGIAYDNSEVLEEGIIYYGAIRSEFGCESNTRLEVSISYIECIGDLLIPDGFSPNGDTINDTFDVLFLNDLYPNFKLSIYNRYGNILYEGDINSPQWDGTWKNNNTVLPVGVYFYIIEFNDGETEPRQGRVYLSR